jgi:hypothetical protein
MFYPFICVVTPRFSKKNKTCQVNAFHINSNRKISNNLIGCILWHAKFYFWALCWFHFLKRFKFHFEIFFWINSKAFRLNLGWILIFKQIFKSSIFEKYSKSLFKLILVWLLFKFVLEMSKSSDLNSNSLTQNSKTISISIYGRKSIPAQNSLSSPVIFSFVFHP